MGSNITKNRVKGPNNDFSVNGRSLRSIPYRFLDTGTILSYDRPNLIKIFSRPLNHYVLGLQQHLGNGSTSSLAFLADENRLLFGTICLGALNCSDRRWRTIMATRAADIHTFDDNLCLVNLHTGDIEKLIGYAVRDISVSSSTEHVAFLTYLGYSHLQLWQFNSNTPSNFINRECVDKIKALPSMTSHATCCSISPNGKWLVFGNCSDFFTIETKNHLVVYTVYQNGFQNKSKSFISDKIFPEILLSLEFSSDSEFLAVGSFTPVPLSRPKIFLFSTKTWQIISDVGVKGPSPYTTVWGAFNPLSTHRQLLCLTEFGWLQKWDTTPLYDLNQQPDGPIDNMCITDEFSEGTHVTSCPKFSPDGNMFVLPLSDGSVVILDPNLFEKLWVIICPDFQAELQQTEQLNREQLNISQPLQATSVCFSKSCEYLAIGYSGYVVSVWLLPRMHFTLKHLCRSKIISMCAPNLVHKLPIPNALKHYLLYQS